MAIINEPANLIFTEPNSPGELQGARVIESVRVVTIGATDSNGSAYQLGEISNQCQLLDVQLEGPAITGGTAFTVGLTDMQGNIIDNNCLMTTTDFSSVAGLPTGPLGGAVRHLMGAVGIANANLRPFELAGQSMGPYPGPGATVAPAKYKIVLFAATIGTSGGVFAARVSQRIYG